MKRTARWLLFLAALPLMPAANAALVQDPASLQLLRTAAEDGNAEAMLELGILYEYGFRMPDNKAPALAWYRLAAEAGNAKAGARHDALKGSMSGKEIEAANKLYIEYIATKRPASRAETPPPAAPNAPEAPPKTETAPKESARQEAPSPTSR